MPAVVLGVGAYALASKTVLYTALFGLRFALQDRAKRKARRAFNEGLQDRLVQVALADGARSRVYGRCRVADGILFKGTHGDKKQFFTMVVALAGHEIDAVEQVYFDDKLLALDANGYVQTAPWNGQSTDTQRVSLAPGQASFTAPGNYITGSAAISLQADGSSAIGPSQVGSYTASGTTLTSPPEQQSVWRSLVYQTAGVSPKARVRFFNGSSSQDLSSVLAGSFPALIQPGAHRFAGIACLLVELEYSEDAFPGGLPAVSAVVRGAKVLDPRDGITRWTENPALIARDWALHPNGGGATAAELDEPSIIAAANACDVVQLFRTDSPDGPMRAVNAPTYLAGLVARTDAAPDQVLDSIVEAMAGRWAWAGGKLRMVAGSYRAPVADITEDWVSDKGDIEIIGTVARTELANVITASIANKDQAYVVAPIPRIAPAEYIAADGGEYPLDVQLEAVTDEAHAAHVASCMLREGRQALTVSLTCNNRALVLELFDTVTVTLPRFGWAAKLFEVLAWGFTLEGGIRLTLRETDASVYQLSSVFTRADPAPNSALPNPFAVPAVAPSSLTSGNATLLKQIDGTIVPRLRVTWPAVQDEAVRASGSVEIKWGPANSDPATWATHTAPGTDTQALLTGVQDGAVYAVITRCRNSLVAGAWSLPQQHVVLGKSAPPSDVSGFTASAASGLLQLSWAACPDADYAETELRVGASWAAGTPIWRGAGTAYAWRPAAPGSYTAWARHVDTSGNLSPSAASAGADVLDLPAQRPNLLRNGGFSNGTADWTIPGGLGFFLQDGVWGRTLISVSAAAGPLTFAIVHDAVPAQAGEWYVVHGDALLFASGGVSYFDLQFLDAGGATLLDGPGHAIAAGNDFAADDTNRRRYAVEAQAPAGTVAIRARFVVEGASGISAVGCRNVKVERGRLPYTAYSGGQQDVALAQAAAAAQSTANTANTNAGTALSTLATMRSNGYLDAAEKPSVIKEWLAISGERAGIVAQANAYGITTERDYYTAAHDALASYLAGLSPSWDNTSVDTPIIPAADQSVWAALYNTRQWLLNKTAEEAGKRADWSGVGGTGKPQDNATKNVVTYSASAPGGPTDGDIWIDTSVTPRTIRMRLGGTWQLAGTYTTDTAQLTDGAQLGLTALWSGVAGSGKPQDNATKNVVTYSASAPGGPTDGDIWIDTSVTPRTIRMRLGGTWQLAGTYTTDTAQLTDGAQLGLTALWSGVAGSGKPADNATRNPVYFQDSDPGSVPDGSIWISSTKARQRIGGAWQPYVGAGSVGTGEIEPDAATVVVTSYLAGPVNNFNDV